MNTSKDRKRTRRTRATRILQAAAAAGLHRLAPARAAVKMRQSSRPGEGVWMRVSASTTRRRSVACCS